MIKPSRLALFQLWLSLNPLLIGFVSAVVVVAAAFGIAVIPIAPPKAVSGVVEHLTFGAGRRMSRHVAYVRLADRDVLVDLPDGQSCLVGSRIGLVRTRHLWGDGFDADLIPCTPPKKN